MSEIKPTEWIETVLSRIYMLEPKVGKHMVEKCGRLCAKSGDLIVKARKINAELKEENDITKILNAFRNELNEDQSVYIKDGKIYLEYSKCRCQLVKDGVKNKFICKCSIGYTREVFEALFVKPIIVKLHSSILNGDELCKQSVYVDKISFVPFSF